MSLVFIVSSLWFCMQMYMYYVAIKHLLTTISKSIMLTVTSWGHPTPLSSLINSLIGFFVQRHINLCGSFNAKAILLVEQQWCYLTHSWEDKGVHTFSKDICPKVIIILRLDFKPAYYDSRVQHFNHYITRTPPRYSLRRERSSKC